MRKHNTTRRRLRLTPLILGGYGAFLGLGLTAIGLSQIGEWIGIVRLLMGMGLTGFGLVGIWDGVRDLVRPDRKPKQAPDTQFIITDTAGNRSSIVTPEVLRRQIDSLAESEYPKHFDIQILPPLSVGKHGLLKQVLCIGHGNIILAAFFEMPGGGYRIYQKSTEPDTAAEWLNRLSEGSPDFSQWEIVKGEARTGEGETRFLAKTGTVTQAKFWLTGYLNQGVFKELSGWTDITGQIEKEMRKDKKRHGKIF